MVRKKAAVCGEERCVTSLKTAAKETNSAGEKNILQSVLLSFFSFYFLNALQSDINSNRVYLRGHKYVLGPTQTHFSPSR